MHPCAAMRTPNGMFYFLPQFIRLFVYTEYTPQGLPRKIRDFKKSQYQTWRKARFPPVRFYPCPRRDFLRPAHAPNPASASNISEEGSGV